MSLESDDLKTIDKYVIVFDICSSTKILEETILLGCEQRWRNLLIDLKKLLVIESKNYRFEIYKFIGDGWILLFDKNSTGTQIINFLELLSRNFKDKFEQKIKNIIDEKIKPIGLTFGIDKGRLIQFLINRSKEYIGRPLNLASRLQGAIQGKETGYNPEYNVLISPYAYDELKDSLARYKGDFVYRTLKNISGGDRFRCYRFRLNVSKIQEKNISKKTLSITYPKEIYHKDLYVPISGEGARKGHAIILISSLDGSYLAPQKGEVEIKRNGDWSHNPGCHLLNPDIIRFVYAISVKQNYKSEVFSLLKEEEKKGTYTKDAIKKFSRFLAEKGIDHELSPGKLMIRELKHLPKIRNFHGFQVIWVDDKPGNNVHIRQSLESAGINFHTALSTDDAMKIIKSKVKFDLIISDLKRGSNRKAGLEFLEELLKIDNKVPVIIYAGKVGARKYGQKAKELGAIDVIKDSLKLINLIVRILKIE